MSKSHRVATKVVVQYLAVGTRNFEFAVVTDSLHDMSKPDGNDIGSSVIILDYIEFAEPKKLLYNLLLRMVENLYSEHRTILIVEKPFQTRPVLSSTKKAPGFCIVCGAPATTEALFKVVGAIIIQRYCDKCLSGAKY